jgi:hypothetical protein
MRAGNKQSYIGLGSKIKASFEIKQKTLFTPTEFKADSTE